MTKRTAPGYDRAGCIDRYLQCIVLVAIVTNNVLYDVHTIHSGMMFYDVRGNCARQAQDLSRLQFLQYPSSLTEYKKTEEGANLS